MRVIFNTRQLLFRGTTVPHIRHIRAMSSSKPFILFFNPVRHAEAYYESLQEVARTEVVTSKSRDEFFKDLEGKYKDISVIYRTSASGAVRNVLASPAKADSAVLTIEQNPGRR